MRVAQRIDSLELSLIRQVLQSATPEAVNLGLGEPALPTPEPVLAAARSALEGPVRYSRTAGMPELARRIAARWPHHGGGPDSVLVTAGSQQAIAVLFLGLVDPGDEVLIPELAYPAYRPLSGIAGGRVETYPTPAERGFRLDANEIAQRITQKTRLVILASPGNPTGAVAPAEDVEALSILAEERGFWLVADQIYGELHQAPEAPAQPTSSRSLMVGGPAKSHAMTGFRVGWLVGPEALLARLLPLHQQMVLCAPSLAQQAAIAALDLPTEFLEDVRNAYRDRQAVLLEGLQAVSGLRCLPSDGAYYVLADVRERIGDRSAAFAQWAARSGRVIVIPGESFGETGRGLLRLSFAPEPQTIREGVRRLAQALDDFPGD